MIETLISLLLAALPLPLQTLPHAVPREGAKQLIDNERVAVWDATWAKGKATPMHQHRYDMVVVELAEASVKLTSPDGTSRTAVQHVGQASFVAKGTTHIEEGVSDTPRHAILIDLKDVTVPPLRNTTGLPEAFPREGGKTLIDNPRVAVYDFSWTLGKATEMHFHSKDVVVVYLESGELASTTPDGKTTVTPHTPGEVRFNAGNRSHSELLTKGSERVIAVELK